VGFTVNSFYSEQREVGSCGQTRCEVSNSCVEQLRCENDQRLPGDK